LELQGQVAQVYDLGLCGVGPSKWVDFFRRVGSVEASGWPRRCWRLLGVGLGRQKHDTVPLPPCPAES
jgi:hypothetical protein